MPRASPLAGASEDGASTQGCAGQGGRPGGCADAGIPRRIEHQRLGALAGPWWARPRHQQGSALITRQGHLPGEAPSPKRLQPTAESGRPGPGWRTTPLPKGGGREARAQPKACIEHRASARRLKPAKAAKNRKKAAHSRAPGVRRNTRGAAQPRLGRLRASGRRGRRRQGLRSTFNPSTRVEDRHAHGDAATAG